ncbi:MAG: hypothetical protein R2941_14595 [Desulfobacterales bacterium]
MKKRSAGNTGMELLVSRYRRTFRIPENLNHYSGEDYRNAERKFLKYAIDNGLGI